MPYKDPKARQRWDTEKRREFTAYIREVKAAFGCANCFCFDPLELEFHHIDPAEKEWKITRMHYHSLESVWIEIGKCTLLCGECHAAVDPYRRRFNGNGKHA